MQRLIAGPGGVYICDECIDLCQEIIAQEQEAPAEVRVSLESGAAGTDPTSAESGAASMEQGSMEKLEWLRLKSLRRTRESMREHAVEEQESDDLLLGILQDHTLHLIALEKRVATLEAREKPLEED